MKSSTFYAVQDSPFLVSDHPSQPQPPPLSTRPSFMYRDMQCSHACCGRQSQYRMLSLDIVFHLCCGHLVQAAAKLSALSYCGGCVMLCITRTHHHHFLHTCRNVLMANLISPVLLLLPACCVQAVTMQSPVAATRSGVARCAVARCAMQR